MKTDRFGQTPNRRGIRVGVSPRCGRTPTANAAPCLLPIGRARVPSSSLHCVRDISAPRSARNSLRENSCTHYRVGSRRSRRRHGTTAGFSWTSPAVSGSGSACGAAFLISRLKPFPDIFTKSGLANIILACPIRIPATFSAQGFALDCKPSGFLLAPSRYPAGTLVAQARLF